MDKIFLKQLAKLEAQYAKPKLKPISPEKLVKYKTVPVMDADLYPKYISSLKKGILSQARVDVTHRLN